MVNRCGNCKFWGAPRWGEAPQTGEIRRRERIIHDETFLFKTDGTGGGSGRGGANFGCVLFEFQENA